MPDREPEAGPRFVSRPTGGPRQDVAIVGAGVIGLSIALEVARRGGSVTLIGEMRPGEASAAAAGMLAPSVEELSSPVRRFGAVSRDSYPSFLERLREESGIAVPLDRRGILQVTADPAHARAMRERADGVEAQWIDERLLATLEPGLAPAAGALLHANDGAVDNVTLMRSLERAADRTVGVRRVRGSARRVDARTAGTSVELSDGEMIESGQLVIASGAWAAGLEGLPRRIPVRPLRGQMLALRATPLAHVVYGDGGYLVPRGGDRVLVGATMEDAGFDASVTESGRLELREAGARICPELGAAVELDSWAGLRPATPDLLPILGRDKAAPLLLYACGHSRNGILMAPLTAECIAALVEHRPPPCSLTPFDIARFE